MEAPQWYVSYLRRVFQGLSTGEIKPLYVNLIFETMTKFNHMKSHLNYSATADPSKIINVAPEEIIHKNTNTILSRRGLGQIRNGNWDRDVTVWRDGAPHHGLKQRFKQGIDWKETDYVKHAKQRLEERNSYRGHESVDDFIKYRCSFLDEMHESMALNGWSLNCDQFTTGKSTNVGRSSDADFIPWPEHRYEPFACIGRDGDIQRRQGAHRITIAEIVGIEKIPMNVLVRHKQWQEIRDEVYQARSYDELSERAKKHLDHPDLQPFSVEGRPE